MSYDKIDSILIPWADSRRLHIHTDFKDVEVRSIDIVSPKGERFQIWIDEPDNKGNTAVHVWNMKKRKKDYSATLSSFLDQLEVAYQQVLGWF
jgi:hypothetical protein